MDYEEAPRIHLLMSAFFGREGITDITSQGLPESSCRPQPHNSPVLLPAWEVNPNDIDVYVADARGSPAWATAEDAAASTPGTARIHQYIPRLSRVRRRNHQGR